MCLNISFHCPEELGWSGRKKVGMYRSYDSDERHRDSERVIDKKSGKGVDFMFGCFFSA